MQASVQWHRGGLKKKAFDSLVIPLNGSRGQVSMKDTSWASEVCLVKSIQDAASLVRIMRVVLHANTHIGRRDQSILDEILLWPNRTGSYMSRSSSGCLLHLPNISFGKTERKTIFSQILSGTKHLWSVLR